MKNKSTASSVYEGMFKKPMSLQLRLRLLSIASAYYAGGDVYGLEGEKMRFKVEQQDYYAPKWAIIDTACNMYYICDGVLFYKTKSEAQDVIDLLNRKFVAQSINDHFCRMAKSVDAKNNAAILDAVGTELQRIKDRNIEQIHSICDSN